MNGTLQDVTWPEKVEVPLVVLQQAYVALQAAGRIPLIAGLPAGTGTTVSKCECAAEVLRCHVQRAMEAQHA